jgi:hypothetical protein
MDKSQGPGGERFWAQNTKLQLVFLGVAGIAFLIGLVAIIRMELGH